MSERAFVGRALRRAVRGYRGAGYPIFLECVASAFRWGLAFAVLRIAVAILSGDTELFNPHTVPLWSVFIGFPAAGWWVFSAACKVAWWRHYECAGDAPGRDGRWTKDLLAMMAVELIFGAFGGLCFLSVALCLYAIFIAHHAPSVIGLALSLIVLSVCGIFHPVVTACRIAAGPGLLRAFANAFRVVARHPFKTLAVRIVPGLAMVALWGTACVEMFLNRPWIAALAITISTFIPLIYPAFWIELARTNE